MLLGALKLETKKRKSFCQRFCLQEIDEDINNSKPLLCMNPLKRCCVVQD